MSPLTFSGRYGSGNPEWTLLGGFMGSPEDWRAVAADDTGELHTVVEELAPFPYRPSMALEDEPCLDQFADLVRRRTNMLGLIGYSMGGRLALHAAVRHPESVPALIMISASPGIEDPVEREMRLVRDMELAARLEAMTDDPAAHRRFLETWYDMPLFALKDRRPALREAIIARRLTRTHLLAVDAANMHAYTVGSQPDHWPAIARLPMPILAIAGEHDTAYAAIAERIAATARRGLALIIPDAGHALHLEKPAAVRRAIDDFAASVAP